MTNPGLLKKFDVHAYPGEFLVARLHGKNGGLFRNWDFLIAADDPVEQLQGTIFYPFLRKDAQDGIWLFLRHEYEWIYHRMNGGLRRTFEPYFVYWEMNSLVNVIRQIHRKKEETIVRQLDNSLLNRDILKILTSGRKLPVILGNLEKCFMARAGILDGLHKHYAKHGIRSLEIFIREGLLAHMICRSTTPILKNFSRQMVDFHNCMALAKNIRWEIEDEKVFIGGGTVAVEKLRRALSRKDTAVALQLFPMRSGKEENGSLSGLEKKLLAMITRNLQRLSRQRTATAEILFYLWEQYRYARNIGMVLNTMQLNDETVTMGIVA